MSGQPPGDIIRLFWTRWMSTFLKKVVQSLVAPTGLTPEEIRVLIETPRDPGHGEYAFPCFSLAKKLRKSPGGIAKDLAGALGETEDFAAAPVGPYLNFKIPPRRLAEVVLPEIRRDPGGYGCSKEGMGKTVALDYSHPNIAKPFGIGHLRSTVIGNSLKRIFEALGWKTVSINHLGDWGTQFGLMIVAYRRWGDEKALQADPIEYLYGMYIRINEEAKKDEAVAAEGRAAFRELEEGKKEARALWQRFRDLSLAEFNRLYERLGISFDSYAGEAFFDDRTREAVQEMIDKGLPVEVEGALKVELEGLPEFTVRKSDGASGRFSYSWRRNGSAGTCLPPTWW